MAKLETIEGIGPIYAQKLRAAGIRSTNALLQAGATPEGRKELEEKTGIGHEYMLDWVNRADLMRIRGVGKEYSGLLEKAGVDTVRELAERNPVHLHQALRLKSVGRSPSLGMVTNWVQQAGLPGDTGPGPR